MNEGLIVERTVGQHAEFGKISRLALAQAGSVLNYGYLGELQVPGQWAVGTLRERLREIAGD